MRVLKFHLDDRQRFQVNLDTKNVFSTGKPYTTEMIDYIGNGWIQLHKTFVDNVLTFTYKARLFRIDLTEEPYEVETTATLPKKVFDRMKIGYPNKVMKSSITNLDDDYVITKDPDNDKNIK